MKKVISILIVVTMVIGLGVSLITKTDTHNLQANSSTIIKPLVDPPTWGV